MTRVHLISGFLGTGKTTAILHLLQQRPANEKWAVLVNEFGEVGIDGSILRSKGITVREVPGGCLCCVSGLPFQMGLNMLLAKERPDVLLIEPSGLGHPQQVMQTLLDEHYHDSVMLGASLCLIDPRHLLEARYLHHDVFVDQIRLADVLIANKTDLANEEARQAFQQLLVESHPQKSASAWIEQGQVALEVLQQPRNPQRLALTPKAHAQNKARDGFPIILPLQEHESHRRLENAGQGYFSVGWLFQPEPVFDAHRLRDWLSTLEVERAKGLVRTNEGCLVMNMREGVLSEMQTRDLGESRLELISDAPFASDVLEQQLLACLAVSD